MKHLTLLSALSLAFVAGSANAQGFSPDSKQLAVPVRNPAGPASLATLNVDGSGYRVVANDLVGAHVAWSPTGQSALYCTGAAAPVTCLLDPLTGGSRKMTYGLTGPYAWREDCARYAGVDRSVNGQLALLECSADDGTPTLRIPLTGVGPNFTVTEIIWLPNTDNLAFIGVQGGSRDIYLAEAGEVTKVTTSVDVIGFGLSADRTKLVWARESKNTRYILTSVYTFDLTKRSSERLQMPERVTLVNPDPRNAPSRVNRALFSPDGARIALLARFDKAADKKNTKPSVDLVCYTMGLDGSDAHTIYRAPDVGADFTPAALRMAWSPDGKTLAYVGPLSVANTDPKWCVKVIPTDGSGAKNIH